MTDVPAADRFALDSELLKLAMREGFDVYRVNEPDPLNEIVLMKAVRASQRPEWPLTLRLYTGIIPAPENEDEARVQQMHRSGGMDSRFIGGRGEWISLCLIWRDQVGGTHCIGTMPGIRRDASDCHEQLIEQLEAWQDCVPPACPECGSPTSLRKPKSKPNWEYACRGRPECSGLVAGPPFGGS